MKTKLMLVVLLCTALVVHAKENEISQIAKRSENIALMQSRQAELEMKLKLSKINHELQLSMHQKMPKQMEMAFVGIESIARFKKAIVMINGHRLCLSQGQMTEEGIRVHKIFNHRIELISKSKRKITLPLVIEKSPETLSSPMNALTLQSNVLPLPGVTK